MPETFADPVTDVLIHGEIYRVSPIRMGAVFRLQAVLDRLPPPPAVQVATDPGALKLALFEAIAEGIAAAADLSAVPADKMAEHLTRIRGQAYSITHQHMRDLQTAAGPPELASTEGVRRLAADEGGAREILFEALSVHRPELTRDEAGDLLRTMHLAPFRALINAYFSMGDTDPKAKGPASPESSEAGDPSGSTSGNSSAA